MKIDSIRVCCLALPMPRPLRTPGRETAHTYNALIEVCADGLVGQGVAFAFKPNQAHAICSVLVDLAEELQGRDPREVRAHWERLRRRLSLTGDVGIGILALSAIDTALWDLLGQVAGLPLYRLLGAAHAELPVYAQGGWVSDPIEHVVEEALMYAECGYRHYKMRAGALDWRRDVQRVEKVREALNPSVKLLVDANQGWSTLDALSAARALDHLGLFWLEDPVEGGNIVGSAQVAAAITTPVATGESLFGPAGFRSLIDLHAAAILLPDLQHCGGPTGFLLVAAQADLANLPVCSHLFTQVSVHLLAACSNALIVEYMPGWWDELFDRPLDIADGTIRPPQEPGLGVRFSELALRQLAPV